MIDVMDKRVLMKLLLTAVLFFGAQAALAAPTEIETVKAALKGLIKVDPDSVNLTQVDGLYEIAYGSKIVYMTKDGNFLIEGDVYDVKKGVNLTENVRQVGRKKVIDSLDPEHEIIFSPKEGKAKYVITAFTDIDCGYCRKLHKEMKQYNDLGIEMRYVAFPRSGPKTESYYKAVAVWCAKDRNKAMTFAKGGA
ncbi:disulfide isomerase DsbC N-terminal domain-containing protein, partial [Kaarinaea lacus]